MLSITIVILLLYVRYSKAVPHTSGSVWPDNEINYLLRKKDAVEEYTRRSDCFRIVTGMIRSRCEQLDMMEEERVKAAISMSLCELATAKHHSIPMECAPFTINQPSSTSPPGSQGECVSALSRSAQFWSSYSGYLREIPQLCFTFQRWNNIDVARNIYHNITLEKLTLIKVMQEREKEGKANAEAWKFSMAELLKTAAYIRNVSQQMDVRIEIQADEISQTLLKAVDILERRVETVLDKSLNELSGNFAVSLETVVSNLDEGLRSRLGNILITFHEQQQQLFIENSVIFDNHWRTTQSGLLAMQESISELSRTATQAALEILNTRDHSFALRQVQEEITQSTHQLVGVVHQLAEQTKDHINEINDSALALKQNLRDVSEMSRAQMWSDWWTDSFMMACTLILRVNPAQLFDIFQSPAFKFLRVLFSVSYQLLKVTFSILTSLLLFFLSIRGYSPFHKGNKQTSTFSLFTSSTSHSSSAAQEDLSIPLPYSRGRSRSTRISRIPNHLCRPSS